jgi:hypothetical protein
MILTFGVVSGVEITGTKVSPRQMYSEICQSSRRRWSEQTLKVTATFEITKDGIISPKASEQMYRIFIRERKKFLLLAMNEILVVMSENFQSNCNLEGYGELTGGI